MTKAEKLEAARAHLQTTLNKVEEARKRLGDGAEYARLLIELREAVSDFGKAFRAAHNKDNDNG